PTPPSIVLSLTPSFPVIPGQKVLVHVIAASVADISFIALTADGQPISLDSQGRATLTAGAIGQHLLQATATDLDGLIGHATSILKVRQANDDASPIVSFDASMSHALIQSATNIIGTVSDTNLDSWKLQLLIPGSTETTLLASGESPIGGILTQLNPDSLPN